MMNTFSKRTKWPLGVAEFNVCLAEFGEAQRLPFVPAGGGRELQAKEKTGEAPLLEPSDPDARIQEKQSRERGAKTKRKHVRSRMNCRPELKNLQRRMAAGVVSTSASLAP